MDKLIDMVSGKAGRILYAIPVLIFGLFHFMAGDKMAGAVPVPGGVFWVYLTGVALIAGAVGIVTNLNGLGPLAAFLTGVLVLVFLVTVEIPGMMKAEGMAQQMAMASLLKGIAMVAGAFVIAGTYRRS